MSVVCYRDGVMASDSGIFIGDVLIGNVKKIIKTDDGFLAGACGNAEDSSLFLDVASEGMDDDMVFSEECKFISLNALYVNPKGEVFSVGNKGYPFKVDAPFYAEGAGAEIALGAMAAGASAEEAVEIAIKYSIWCTGPVKTIKLGV